MRGPGWAAMAALVVAAPAFGQVQPSAQATLDQLAAMLGYRFAVVDNRPQCPAGLDPCFLATITLTVPATAPAQLPEGLALYFSFVDRLPRVESDVFAHQLINGDLQRLTLKPGAALKPGSTHVIRLWGTGANFSKAFAMPNAYLTADGLAARTIVATRPAIDPDTGLELLRFVAPMTDEARLATKSDADKTRWLTAERAFDLYVAQQAPGASGVVILPKPVKAVQGTGAAVDLTRGVAVEFRGVAREAVAPALAALGVAEGGKLPLSIRVDSASPIAPEGYRLDASAAGIVITARDAAGASHALRSLAQQAAFEQGRMRPLTIEDAPRYGFRGLHIDLGRNFHGRDQILKLIEAIAAYKLNRLHLHLADDEGWRIEIPALPELAAIGSKRCHDPSEVTCLLPQLGAGPDGTSGVNGYLSTADYIAILKAAAARQIEVIPSIDMPGHSRAAIVAMEARHAWLSAAGKKDAAERYRLVDPADATQYRSIQNYNDNTLNVCLPSTYRFVDTVVDALVAMHREAGVPLRIFHLGADETAGAWAKSPACAKMIAENGGDTGKLTPRFIERVAAGLAAKGIRTAGWSDGMGHTDPARMPAQVQTNIWGVLHNGAIREAHDQLNRGWDVVLSIPDLGYFDMPYAPHPEEGGYNWASRGVSTHQVFGFMPDNLPANAATIRTTFAEPKAIEDKPVLEAGQKIAGVQAQLWSETIRTDAQVDYMLFPRLFALAERGWTPAPWTPPYQAGANYRWHDPRVDAALLTREWRGFAGRVTAQLPLLDRMGIAYRVTPPGARIAGGKLEANSAFPGMVIEYRMGDGWKHYAGPVAVTGAVELRTRSADGKRASRIVRVEPAPRD
ncbi:carbohydate-binding domain-containing protein [Sphingomonas sp. BT-65]|uniref:family 20 glycosylhydrolase n=1 Tax=Sphingomonas sp. BT-65 TaxID=2989821 RepID=UPI0022368160|nr:family 20 glycosylhydrolase [Sphingomonas sp. BT-65]MCW4463417.1 carbohydate-binding domain-containing protein [Sphingomonas sp. BT-65]